MPQYKLLYFDVWGIAEPIRFIFKYAGVEFEDLRIARDKTVEWLKIKPTTPFGQVPVMEIDGKQYAQTIPICHYLAKQFNLIGETDLDALQIDSIANTLLEFRKHCSPYFLETDPVEKAKKKVELLEKTIPFYMGIFENLTSKNGGFLHGGNLSYADLFFVAILDCVNNVGNADVTQDYPNLKKLTEKVRSFPSIKNWLDERPKSEF